MKERERIYLETKRNATRRITSYSWIYRKSSAHVNLARTTQDDWCHSSIKGLKRLKQQTNNIGIVGFSFGGNLAIHLASSFPDIVRAVVVMGTPIYFYQFPYIFAKTTLFHLLNIPLAAKSWDHKNLPLVLDDGTYSVWPTASISRAFDFIHHYTRKEIQTIQQPLYVIHSLHDDFVRSKSAKYLFRQSASPKKRNVMGAQWYALSSCRRPTTTRVRQNI